ncbi:MAG: hypothetical protein EOP14_00480 [Pseudomonas sp.]|nr:MAG: hypothetical protein EOP14_00480 [Pseudomonas sp.]
MDTEDWLSLLTFAAVIATLYIPFPAPISRLLGAFAGTVGTFYGFKYLLAGLDDGKGRDWKGCFLPFAIAGFGIKACFFSTELPVQRQTLTPFEMMMAMNECERQHKEPIPIYDKDDPIRVFEVQCGR